LESLWLASADESRVEAHVSDVISVQHVGQESVQTETVAAVRERAILSLKHKYSN
jgi:hypothetical protein